MRIAQVAPLHESVPPKLYGGTERVVHWLTEELVRMGHEVTLFASADSRTSASLVGCCPRALRLDPTCTDRAPWHVLMIERVATLASRFDVIHFHTDLLHLPLARRLPTPSLTTLHGRLDLDGLGPLYRELGDTPLAAISAAQRAPLRDACWVGTVHHGLPVDRYRPGRGDGGYLVFLGRISPEKRPDRAIEIAISAGIPIKIAAKVDAADAAYFERTVRPLLDHPLVEMLGEVDDARKHALLARAAALLFPIDWPEPFGLVMIEAMACGTPVLAYRRGSVPEIVEDGVTGFVVSDVLGALEALRALPTLDRRRVRTELERRFSSERMARDYLSLYRHVRVRRARGPRAA